MNIFQHENIIKPPLLPFFYILSYSILKFFHPVVLYENYLICIFMNIHEILKIREKTWVNYSMQRGNQT